MSFPSIRVSAFVFGKSPRGPKVLAKGFNRSRPSCVEYSLLKVIFPFLISLSVDYVFDGIGVKHHVGAVLKSNLPVFFVCTGKHDVDNFAIIVRQFADTSDILISLSRIGAQSSVRN